MHVTGDFFSFLEHLSLNSLVSPHFSSKKKKNLKNSHLSQISLSLSLYFIFLADDDSPPPGLTTRSPLTGEARFRRR